MNSSCLLDTCAAIWLVNGDPIHQAGRIRLEQSLDQGEPLYVSAITAWELATLAAKERLSLTVAPEDWFSQLLALPGIELAPLTPSILMRSASLPGKPPTDPADRMIIASAREYGSCLITRDAKILDYATYGHVDAQAC